MIRSLIKHDLKRMTMNLLIYEYIIAIGLAGITRLINIGSNIQAIAIIGYVFSSLTYSAIASILVNTFVQTLRVFVCNFYKDESYLTHTLPVTKNNLLLSKFLSSIIVIFSSILVCFLSLFILFYTKELGQMLKIWIESVVYGFNMSVGGFMLLLVVLIFSQICAMISMAFCAIVKSNMYNNKKSARAFLWFAIYYFGAMIVTLLTMVIVFAIKGSLAELTTSVMSQSAFLLVLILGLILYLAFSVFYYSLCNRLFNKGVNVD